METPWDAFYETEYVQNEARDISVYDLFCETTKNNENKIAITYASTNFTYKQLKTEVDLVADILIQRGVKKGCVVSIISPMIPAVMILFLAANKVGAICSFIDFTSTDAQINRMLIEAGSEYLLIISRRAHRLEEIVANTKIKVVSLCSDKDYLGVLDKLRMHFYSIKLQDDAKSELAVKIDGVRIRDWNYILNRYLKKEDNTFPKVGSDTKALYLHHSSLLDNHEIEVFDNKAIIASANNVIAGYNISKYKSDTDGVLCAMNYVYSGVLVSAFVGMLCTGVRIILNPYYNVSTFMTAISFFKPSIIIGYPTTFTALAEELKKAKNKKKSLESVKLLIASGTSFVTTKRKYCEEVFEKYGCHSKISVCYGLSECLSTCSFVPANCDKNNSIGIPFPGVYMKIIDKATQRELVAGEKGEICVSSEGMLSEVLNNDVITSRILRKHRDGKIWVHTGDVGHIDDDGFFYFDYVEKRCAKINGISVSLKQVEDVIKTVYGVFDACVVDYCNDAGDTEIVAWVVPIESYLSDNDKLTALLNSIELECEMLLSSVARPTDIEYKAYLPRNGSGVDYATVIKAVIDDRLGNNTEEN